MFFRLILHRFYKKEESQLGRILSIDYGGKRTGLAMTDPLQISINPLPTCPTADFPDRLVEYLEGGEITEVVAGLPAHSDGTITPIGLKIQKLLTKMETKYPEIIFAMIDESFSSKDARQMLILSGVKKKKRQEKGTVDQMSAVLILRDYLNNK